MKPAMFVIYGVIAWLVTLIILVATRPKQEN